MPRRKPDAFRDFGILPQQLQPPPQCVRSFLSQGRIVGQYIGTGLVAALGLGLATLLALTMPFPLNLLGCAAALMGFGTFVYLATHNDYRWVELDGKTLRAKQLYTGRIIERSLEEIDSLGTMVYQIRREETEIIESMLGRVKGIEVRFRDRRTPLRILRADPAMTNAKELIEAILFRMGQIREVDAEIVEFVGKPLVRHIHWKGETPSAPPTKNLKICLCCIILMALMFGPILGFIGRAEKRLYLLGSVPPRTIALQTLIDNGPADNPHVVLTDFRFGGYIVETRNSGWSRVWIALFPAGKKDRLPGKPSEETKEIKAVLSSNAIPNEAALRQLLRQQRVTGICSDSPGWSGGTLRTQLMESNPGAQLTSAWEITELKELPSADRIRNSFLGSAACYVVAIALAIVVFLKA